MRARVLAQAKRYRLERIDVFRARDATQRKSHPAKIKAASASWRSRNKDRIKDYNADNRKKYYSSQRAYKKAHRAQISAKTKEWEKKNPGFHKRYRKAHPEIYMSSTHKRRAKIMGCPVGEREAIYKWHRAWKAKPTVVCYWCKNRVSSKKAHADHITPFDKGGAHSIENLCVSCQPCNSSKNARTLSDWNTQLLEPVLL